MKIDVNSNQPIFAQLAEALADAILAGTFPEESQLPSVAEIAANLKINPATANKGVNQLVESGIAYKRRGMGMFVRAGAVEYLRTLRQKQFYDHYIVPLGAEAKRLQLGEKDVHAMIERSFREND